MLLESQDIGPVPCVSPNFVLDFQICLQQPLKKSIKIRYGIKKDIFREEWKHSIFNEIADQWDYLLPSLQRRWTLSKYIMILSFILFFAVPINVILFGHHVHDMRQKVIICGSSCFCFLVIGSVSFWYFMYGLSNKFRKRLVKLLRSYVRELPEKFMHNFDYTMLYPVIYRFAQDNIDPQEQIYCVLRISDGVIVCDSNELEPIYYTTSYKIRKIHSKKKLRSSSQSRISTFTNYKDENSVVSYTPRSETNPPILHQMKRDNHKNYGLLSPFTNNHTPLVNKFNFSRSVSTSDHSS